MSAPIYLHEAGQWRLSGVDPPTVVETITTAERFLEVAGGGDPGTYWIRGDLGEIGGVFGANPAGQIIFRGHPDDTGRIAYLYLQASSNLRFERIHFDGAVELRMHSTVIVSPNHIEFYQCRWEDIDDTGFCVGVSNTFTGSSVEDILIDSCTFARIPVAQTAGQDWSQWDSASGEPGFDNGYGVYLIGGHGVIRRATVRDCTFTDLINDAIQVASADDLTITGNTIQRVAYYSRTVGGRHADPLQSQTATNVTFSGNMLILNDQPMQLQDGNHDWLIENNLIVGTHGPGFGFGHFWGTPELDIGVTNMVFRRNTVWDVGVDSGGYPAGLWRGGGSDNTFEANLLQRGLGGGQDAWDTPVGVGDGYQFSSGGDNLILVPLTGASPPDVTGPDPGFPAMAYARDDARYADSANWVPVDAAHAGRGWRP
jgi:hypothetical protein